MADSATQPASLELQQQREQEFAQLDRQYRLERTRTQRATAQKKQRADARKPSPFSPTAGAQEAVLKAWTAAWQRAHEVIEDFSFALFGAGFLIAGPAATLLYIIRVVGAYAFGGFAQIQSPSIPAGVPLVGGQGITVPMIPPFGIGEGIYRTAKVGLMAVLTLLLWAIFILILFFIIHPEELIGVFGISNAWGLLADIIDFF